MWRLVPLLFNNLQVDSAHGLKGSLRGVGAARRVWRGEMMPPGVGESGVGRLVGAMRGEPRGFRSGSDSAGAPPPFWFYTLPSRSGLLGRVGPRRGSWRCGTSFID